MKIFFVETGELVRAPILRVFFIFVILLAPLCCCGYNDILSRFSGVSIGDGTERISRISQDVIADELRERNRIEREKMEQQRRDKIRQRQLISREAALDEMRRDGGFAVEMALKFDLYEGRVRTDKHSYSLKDGTLVGDSAWNVGDTLKVTFVTSGDGKLPKECRLFNATVNCSVEAFVLDPNPSDVRMPKKGSSASSGSGFFIAKDVVVTCAHVIDSAERLSCFYEKKEFGCSVIAVDRKNDLAILRVRGCCCEYYLPVESKPCVIAQKVFTIGYPLSSMIGVAAKYSEGVIGSIYGIGDDVTCYQISVPVQPGNSGGPLLCAKTGGVVGVVAAKLDDAAVASLSGAIPQGVNYAVKVNCLTNLLKSHGIKFADTSDPDECDSDPDIVRRGTVLIKAYGICSVR